MRLLSRVISSPFFQETEGEKYAELDSHRDKRVWKKSRIKPFVRVCVSNSDRAE